MYTAGARIVAGVMIVLLFLVKPQVQAGKPEMKQTTVLQQKDIEYAQVEGESLRLDLYRPAQDTRPADSKRPLIRHPGLLFIHGGGWSGGDKSEFADQAREMAARGYVAVSINYRLSPKYHYPANIEDVQRAVRWLRSHADQYHLDPDRIGAMGASAGGHLASMLGVLDTLDTGVGASPASRVNCVVDYFGRMDLTLEQSGPGFHDYRPDYIGKTKAQAPDLYAAASPINHINAKTVPFLIVQGTQDTQVAPIQSERMLAALDKAGIDASLLLLAEQGHGFHGAGAQQAWEAAKAFLDRHLLSP